MATTAELKAAFATGMKPTGADFADLIDGVKGDKGDKGTTGTKGTDGADGFGTQQQYDDIIARLEALETP